MPLKLNPMTKEQIDSSNRLANNEVNILIHEERKEIKKTHQS
jgi:adenylosuccinate lyase